MKQILLSLVATFMLTGLAQASEWTPVLSYTAMENSPSYRDVLIHNPGTYSEVRLQMNGAGYVDRFDTISHVLWGREVDGLSGHYERGESRTASFDSRQVRWVRLYVRSTPPGQPVNVQVWMR